MGGGVKVAGIAGNKARHTNRVRALRPVLIRVCPRRPMSGCQRLLREERADTGSRASDDAKAGVLSFAVDPSHTGARRRMERPLRFGRYARK